MIDFENCMNGLSSSTKLIYSRGYKRFLGFVGLSPEELIEEAKGDRKRQKEEGLDIVMGKPEERVRGFLEYLRGFEGKHGKLSSAEVQNGIKAVNKFYKANGIKINLPLPKASRKTKTKSYRPEDIKRLLDVCESLRDRAIILCMFQGGLGAGELTTLNIMDVKAGLDSGEEPLLIDFTTRGKLERLGGKAFYTFISHDACEAVKLYLDAREKGMLENVPKGMLKPSDPLFISQARMRKPDRILGGAIQTLFRILTVKAGLTTEEEMRINIHNPYKPHALRKAFKTVLAGAGVNTDYIEFMMGHVVPYGGAYLDTDRENLRKEYKRAEKDLNIVTHGVSSKEVLTVPVKKIAMTTLKMLNLSYEEVVDSYLRTMKITKEEFDNTFDFEDFAAFAAWVRDWWIAEGIAKPIAEEISERVFKEKMQRKCPYCDQYTDKDSDFCTFCGKALNSKCPKCEKTIELNATFCKYCGTKVNKQAEGSNSDIAVKNDKTSV